MMQRINYADTCKIKNTNNDTEVEAEVLEFKPNNILVVSLNRSVKIILKHNGKIYVGSMAGMEFTSQGPKETITYTGRK